MKTSVIFREAWSPAAKETAKDFQMTLHWTGPYFELNTDSCSGCALSINYQLPALSFLAGSTWPPVMCFFSFSWSKFTAVSDYFSCRESTVSSLCIPYFSGVALFICSGQKLDVEGCSSTNIMALKTKQKRCYLLKVLKLCLGPTLVDCVFCWFSVPRFCQLQRALLLLKKAKKGWTVRI